MTCQEISNVLPDYLRGTVSESIRTAVDAHRAECPACAAMIGELETLWAGLGRFGDEKPSPALGTFMTDLLDRERSISSGREKEKSFYRRVSGGRFASGPVFRLAAAAVLVAAGFLAGRMTAQTRDIEVLQEQVSGLADLVTISLMNRDSAIERIEGLSLAAGVENPDDRFLSLLLNTLDTDPNVNVRLAAVSALANFRDSPFVRAELVTSLARESSPLVQVSLIDLLAVMREKTAFPVFKAISDDDRSLEAVRNRARWGMKLVLSEEEIL